MPFGLKKYEKFQLALTSTIISILEKTNLRNFFDLTYTPLNSLNKYYKEVSTLNKKNKNILFITHCFSFSGAPLTLFHTALALKERGYNVIIIGFKGGEIIKDFKKAAIPAFVSKTFNTDDKKFLDSLEKFDFIFANTILSYNCVKNINKKKPYLWRISEGLEIETKFCPKYPKLKNILETSDNLYAVSEYTSTFLSKYNKNVKLLIYGIEDVSEKYLKSYEFPTETDKVKFCIIGKWYRRKAQKLVLQAYASLPDSVKNQVELYFIGEHPLFLKSTSNIHILGKKNSEDKFKILAKCDALICPSLDDPNPHVVMEGMMMKKPCILSDKVGQAKYVRDGEDALIVKAGDVEDLKNAMRKFTEDKTLLKKMTQNSYNIFQKHFKKDSYINQVISIIENQLG